MCSEEQMDMKLPLALLDSISIVIKHRGGVAWDEWEVSVLSNGDTYEGGGTAQTVEGAIDIVHEVIYRDGGLRDRYEKSL
jgi:hypothetical protein